MSDSGMKKWAPYKSLIEQTDSLRELDSRSDKVDKPTLSPDEEERINYILVNYHGQSLRISYYKDERIYKINTTIQKIDVNNRRLVLEGRQIINLFDLVDIENI